MHIITNLRHIKVYGLLIKFSRLSLAKQIYLGIEKGFVIYKQKGTAVRLNLTFYTKLNGSSIYVKIIQKALDIGVDFIST